MNPDETTIEVGESEKGFNQWLDAPNKEETSSGHWTIGYKASELICIVEALMTRHNIGKSEAWAIVVMVLNSDNGIEVGLPF